MKKIIAKKWIKALRSGKYKQGQGALKQSTESGDTYHCCLGVLCELHNEDMKKNKKKTLCEKRDLMGLHTFNKAAEVLPPVVQQWAKLGSNNGTLIENTFYTLAELNDTGHSFEKIATIIENSIDVL